MPGTGLLQRLAGKLILKGVDGIVFVADSQASARGGEHRVPCTTSTRTSTRTGTTSRSIPFVIQYNKRDLTDILPLEELRAQINPMGVPDFEGIAIEGKGVFETLSSVSKLVVKTLS